MTQRVLDLVRGRVRIEDGSAPFPVGCDRVAVLVHYSTVTRVSRSVRALVEALLAGGYFVVVASACEAEGDLDWGYLGMPERTAVVRKPNIGYDFGSAAVALDRFPEIARSRYVLIVNDSNLGPFGGIDRILDDFESSAADVWALTSSSQHGYHLQSFFLGFLRGVLSHAAVKQFWRNVQHLDDKRDIIFAYEVGLSRLLAEQGYVMRTLFSNGTFDAPGAANLAVTYWMDLLVEGYPFVKRELVANPAVHATAPQVPAIVQRLYGENVREWV